MVRILLIVMAVAVCIALAMILYSIWTSILREGSRHLRPMQAVGGGKDMAPSGIQKAAYIALIVVLFGVASGWLGGL
ncbi:MAG: hypothetical protein AAF307_09110 [Pseudomonadota bacterium]